MIKPEDALDKKDAKQKEWDFSFIFHRRVIDLMLPEEVHNVMALFH